MTGTQLLRNRFSVCTTEGIVLFSAKAREETQVVKRQAKQHRKCEWDRTVCIWDAEINQLDLINYFGEAKQKLKTTVLFLKAIHFITKKKPRLVNLPQFLLLTKSE